MTLKEAMKRIEALEQKVLELQVRPAQQIHYHYPQQPLYGYQGWQYAPYIPSPGITWGAGTTTTCGAGSGLSGYAS